MTPWLDCPTVRDVIVYRRTGTALEMKAGRDLWWHELDENAERDL